MQEFTPRIGEVVEVEVAEGKIVRHNKTTRKLETGNQVTWSTYFSRRQKEGSITPRPLSPAKPSRAKAAEKEG